MRISIDAAAKLVDDRLIAAGYDSNEAKIITDHLMDCELRGVDIGGLARAVSVVERAHLEKHARKRMEVVRETDISASIDGCCDLGYLVAHKATEIAIGKAQKHGIAIVGAFNTWFTGMFSHYMEMAATANVVAIATGSSAWRVAPSSSSEKRFGTNPIAFGFPSSDTPVIIDFATSEVTVSDATLKQRLGDLLPEGVAFDSKGRPTRDPTEALAGAFTTWGGHRGTALAIAIQMTGLLCNGDLMPSERNDCCFLIVAIRPDILVPFDVFKKNVAGYAESVRSARPLDEGEAVRMPFDRSRAERNRRLDEGIIDVPDAIYAALA